MAGHGYVTVIVDVERETHRGIQRDGYGQVCVRVILDVDAAAPPSGRTRRPPPAGSSCGDTHTQRGGYNGRVVLQ